MFSQGNYNSQSGQGPQKPRPPSYSQALPPRLPHNFQQGPLLPSPQLPPRPGQPGLPMFQHGPLAPHFRQVPPAGMPNPGQLYLHRPPAVPGSASLPHLYSTSQQNSQHSYLAPGPPPLPPPRSLPPTTSPGQTLYRPPSHQPPSQTGGVQGLQQIPLPPPPLPTASFPTLLGSGSESTIGNSQMSSMTLPPQPLPPPFPTSQIPPSLRPPSSGTLSGSSSGSSPPPKPAEEIVEKIEELCQLIAKNGSAYEDMARQRETENPMFKFLFGGEPGSEAAIAHNYFLWMKKKCKIEGIEHVVPTNLLTVATESHSPADSDMEMEDDITGSDIDPALNQPFNGPTQATVLKSCEDAEKQLHTLPTLVGSDAAPVISTDTELRTGSTGLGEQGPKFIPSCDVKSSVINLTQATEYPFIGDRENISAPLTDDKSSSGDSGAVERISLSGQGMNGSSPFRLLQDYASNDSSENDDDSCLKDANPKTVSPLVAVSTEGLKLNQDSRLSSKLDSGSRGPYKTERGFGQPSNSGISFISLELSSDSQNEVKETVPTLVASGLPTKHIDAVQNQLSIDHAANSKSLPSADTSRGEWANATLCSKYEKDIEDKAAKFTSNMHKIDKFGRLVREGASDSDSDDSPGVRTHSKRGRSRSWSRSKSPKNRRRRRSRRPRRRRENKSRSRSWSPRSRRSRSRSPRNRRSRSRSPRNRRSGSRSPSFRHASEYRSGGMRWEKGQLQACFDFIRGKCYRGASCRYLHHDSEKSDISRHHRSKQPFVQLALTSKNGNTHEDSKKSSLKISDHEQEIMNQEVQHKHDMSTISILAAKDDTIGTTLHNSDGASSGRVREAAGKGPETKVQERSENATCIDEYGPEAVEPDRPMVIDGRPSKPASNTEVLESYCQASKDMFSSVKDSVIQQSGPIRSHVVLEDTYHPDQQTDDSSVSDLLPDKTSATSPEKLLPTSADSINHLPLPPFTAPAPNLEDSNTPLVAQLPRDHNLLPQTVASQSQSGCVENFPSYMLPNQGSLLSVPLKSSSIPLPPLPPPPPLLPPLLPALVLTVNSGAAQSGVSSQFHQVCLPPKSDLGSQMFSRPPYSTELSGNSQVGEFQRQAYPPVQEPHWPLLHAKDFRLNPLPGSNPSSQQFGSTGKFGEDRLKQLQMQGLNTSDSFTLNNYPQPVSFPQESFAMKTESFPGESLPPGEILKSSSQNPYLQQQQPPHDLHHSVSNSVYGLPGNNSSSSRYQLDHQDRDQSTHLPDSGVTRSSSHFNPYASTFEKPLSSRFSSEVFRQEKDSTYGNKHDHPFSLSHASVDVQGVGSRQATTSPTSAKVVGKIIPASAGEQYDPLFDSIEPSSNSFKKSNNIQKWEPSGNSNIMLRLKDSNQALDVEENNRKKEAGSISLATSLDNEEFGETADAEVGDVENESQSNPDALVNTNMGEIEIDQIKSPGKSRNGKESRSMKLFKACLADFVKEVLKPSWRQGNMSKETFKTVVKKTVDKVAGATKGHQIPKSKAKINQYIDSSQRKLTKLVMGYVDKYAKG